MTVQLFFIRKLYPLVYGGYVNIGDYIQNPRVNTNMNEGKPTVKAYKWIDNELFFVVLDLDRKRIPLSGRTPRITVYDPINGEIVLAKNLEVVDFSRSLLRFKLSSPETSLFSQQNYRFVVTLQDDENETVLFTDQTMACYGNLLVDTAHLPSPKPSFLVLEHEFQPYYISSSTPKTVFVTSAYRTADKSLVGDGIITWQVELDSWFGTFRVIGTQDDVPPNLLESWTEVEQYVFTSPYTGVFWDNIEGRFSYIRFIYENDPSNEGKVKKLIAR